MKIKLILALQPPQSAAEIQSIFRKLGVKCSVDSTVPFSTNLLIEGEPNPILQGLEEVYGTGDWIARITDKELEEEYTNRFGEDEPEDDPLRTFLK